MAIDYAPEPDGGTELDHIESSETVIESTRISDTAAIIWAEIGNGPAPNAVEIAADHGIDVTEIKRTPTSACYRVEI